MTATDKGMAAITPCQNSVAVEWGGQAACKDGLRLLMTNFRYQNTTTVPELGGGVLYEIAQTVLERRCRLAVMIALKPPSVPSIGWLVWTVLFSVLVRGEA